MAAQGNIPVKVGGSWVSSLPSVRVSGAWQDVTEGWVKIAGTWTQFFARVFAFLIAPVDVDGTRSGAGSVTSSATAASVIGGVPAYTYAWTYISGNSFTINSPAAASTTFTTVLPAGVLRSGVYRLTVTDSLAASIFADITVTLESL